MVFPQKVDGTIYHFLKSDKKDVVKKVPRKYFTKYLRIKFVIGQDTIIPDNATIYISGDFDHLFEIAEIKNSVSITSISIHKNDSVIGSITNY